MPSRFSPPEIGEETPLKQHRHRHISSHLLLPLLLAGTITLTIILLTVLTIFIYRKLSRNRTAPSDSPSHRQCRRFSHSLIRRATSSFSASNRLGHGGFGSVYKGTLPSLPQQLAIKVMNSVDSLQGEREFHNELSLTRALVSPHIVPLIGFSSDSRKRRLKTEGAIEGLEGSEILKKKDDNGSILEETESVLTGFEEGASSTVADRSPEASPGLSPEMGMGNQDHGGGSESVRIKDYVMEWIGNGIKKEKPRNEWLASPSSVDNVNGSKVSSSSAGIRKAKNREPREWWKEEFCEELTKKKKRELSSSNNGGEFWRERDGFSGEFRVPKSGGISSTPSMRGTVCYIAPEYGGGGLLSEKCDVYSFGVLVLVIISGRRPLQVTASPMSELERANLISWARQLACNGRLLELVDPCVHSLHKDQALLCITIALLCLQRSPSKRPTMKEIVEMLSGEAEPPHLPFEFSPSPPSNFTYKSRRTTR
ncbi:hypothetical protein like AT2G45590 [Hibiscus trionum]|uniref:Protein kinase domain-containing protein n=1 Tax=Hibiscus trionum TaxID=183268 RepID=A0A9W7IQ06_HIBTR|nr:hypothetical protein like AT2G45590 [Hibiscus trionum]